MSDLQLRGGHDLSKDTPSYFGVRSFAATPDGSEIEVEVTFRAGHRYCCFESACHFAYYSERGWCGVRECMDRHRLSNLPLPVIRSSHGVIERGAVAQLGMEGNPEMCFVWDGAEYRTGPWHPIITRPTESTAATTRPRGVFLETHSSPARPRQ